MTRFQLFTKKIKYIYISVLYMALIFFLSSIPVDEHKIADHSFARRLTQNILHIPMFGLLVFFWVKACEDNGLQTKKAFIYSLAITVCYAAFDELHQSFIPGRYATLSDFSLDVIGCLAGPIVYAIYAKRHKLNLTG